MLLKKLAGLDGTYETGDFESLGTDWKATDRLSFQGDLERYRKQTILQASVSILSPVNGVVPVPRVPDPRTLVPVESVRYFPTAPLEFASPCGNFDDFELSRMRADSHALAASTTMRART